jgi:hypothetical protein
MLRHLTVYGISFCTRLSLTAKYLPRSGKRRNHDNLALFKQACKSPRRACLIMLCPSLKSAKFLHLRRIRRN